jgi:hypothetical protein
MDPAALRPGFPALGRLLARVLRAAAARLERQSRLDKSPDPLAATMELLRRRYPDAPEHWLRFVAERHPAHEQAAPAIRPRAARTAQSHAATPPPVRPAPRPSTPAPPIANTSSAPLGSGKVRAETRISGDIPLPKRMKHPAARVGIGRPVFRFAQPPPSRPTPVASAPPATPNRSAMELRLSGSQRDTPVPRVIRWAGQPASPARMHPRQPSVQASLAGAIAQSRFSHTSSPPVFDTEPDHASARLAAPSRATATTPARVGRSVAVSRSFTASADASPRFAPLNDREIPRQRPPIPAGEPPWPELPGSAAQDMTYARLPITDRPCTTEETHPWNALPF